MHIEPTCVAEMNADPHYDELLADYNLHKSPSNPGMKAAYLLSSRSRDNYAALEQAGMLIIFRAMHEDRMIGGISIMDILNGSTMLVESLYVIERYRNTGAGNALLEAAKGFCRARNIAGLMMSAEPGGVIDLKLTRQKMTVISKMFYIEL